MHILVITFQLEGLSTGEFYGLCDELAPAWAKVPGLVSKVWLDSPETNTFGGIYTWESKQAMDDYLRSELFAAVANHPNFANATAKDYGVIEAPTRVTRGLVGVAA